MKIEKKFDISMFDENDIVNLLMQRSSAVKNKQAIRDWMNGDDTLLREEIANRKDEILEIAFEEIFDVYSPD